MSSLELIASSVSPFAIDIEETREIFFEGPEKTLDVEFMGSGNLRSLPRSVWESVVSEAAATILDSAHNEHCDSYILSESSLFVFSNKVVLKTCGTTTLLHALPPLTNGATSVDLEVGFASFTRKDLQCPGEQQTPHRSYHEEVEYFSRFFAQSSAQVLGPMTADHWYLCTSPSFTPHPLTPAHTISMMMYGLHPSATQKFCKSATSPDGESMTVNTGIRKLLPTALIHGWAFEPCGYSMNALIDQHYATVHVTPESSCSYASYETTMPWDLEHLATVLDIFRPSRFTVALAIVGSPTYCALPKKLSSHEGRHFNRAVFQHTGIEGDREYFVANYRIDHVDTVIKH